jgi:hypothetical protein
VPEHRDLDEFLDEQLPVFDDWLAREGRRPGGRILLAAQLIAEHCIVRVEGHSLAKPLEQPWFPALVSSVKDWYLRRFGAEALTHQPANVLGVISLWSTLFAVHVPLVDERPGSEPGLVEITFPHAVLDHEDPISWVERLPAGARIDSEIEATVRQSVTSVANDLRVTVQTLNRAKCSNPPARGLARAVRHHLAGAAGSLLGEPEAVGLGVWECAQAVEKILKLYLLQQDRRAIGGHDLGRIAAAAVDAGLEPAAVVPVRAFPSKKLLLEYRQGARPSPALERAHEIYISGLTLGRLTAGQITTTGLLPTAKFVIRQWDWSRGFASGKEAAGAKVS